MGPVPPGGPPPPPPPPPPPCLHSPVLVVLHGNGRTRWIGCDLTAACVLGAGGKHGNYDAREEGMCSGERRRRQWGIQAPLSSAGDHPLPQFCRYPLRPTAAARHTDLQQRLATAACDSGSAQACHSRQTDPVVRSILSGPSNAIWSKATSNRARPHQAAVPSRCCKLLLQVAVLFAGKKISSLLSSQRCCLPLPQTL